MLKTTRLLNRTRIARVEALKSMLRTKPPFRGQTAFIDPASGSSGDLGGYLCKWSIASEIYDKKMKELKEEQYAITQKIEEYTQADENYHIIANTVFSLANRAQEIFESKEESYLKLYCYI